MERGFVLKVGEEEEEGSERGFSLELKVCIFLFFLQNLGTSLL